MFDEKTGTDIDLKLIKKLYPNNYKEQIEKMKKGYPVQYIIGYVDFLNTKIEVNENVLIPRFETEYLVEKIINRTKKWKEIPLKVLDICTGSGCIAIAINKNTSFECIGIDISEHALNVAKKNNSENKTNVIFKNKDILNDEINDNYDIIIANPPYLNQGNPVDEETKYEPSIALYAPNEGYLFYEKILEKIKNNPKLIAFEIGYEQAKKIISLAKKKFPNNKITLEQDLCHKDRYIFIEKE